MKDIKSTKTYIFMSFASLFRKSFRNFRTNFKPILTTTFFFISLPQFIFPLISLLFTGSMILDFSDFSSISPVSIVLALIFSLIIWFFLLFALSGITKASLKDKFSFQEIILFGKKGWLKYLGLIILYFIFLLGLSFLFIIPAIIYSIYWFFSFYVIYDENKGILASLKRSKELVKGNWWRIVGHLSIISLIFIVLMIFLLIPMFPLQISYALGELSLGESIRYLVINLIVSIIMSMFYAFFILFNKNIYFELKSKVKNNKNIYFELKSKVKNNKKDNARFETKGFVWYYTRASLSLLSFFIIIRFFGFLGWALGLVSIFTIVISIIHLFIHKKKTIPIIALIISFTSLIILFIIAIIPVFSIIDSTLSDIYSNETRNLINYTNEVLPVGYFGSPNFLIYMPSNVSIDLKTDDFIDTVLVNEEEYYNYKNNLDYQYILGMPNVTHWQLVNYTLNPDKYYILIDPIKDENLTYNLSVISVPNFRSFK